MKSPGLASEGVGDTTRELWEEGCGAQTPSPRPSEISGDETLSEQHKLETTEAEEESQTSGTDGTATVATSQRPEARLKRSRTSQVPPETYQGEVRV